MMNNIKIVFAFMFLITSNIYAQENHFYKSCVKEFYRLYFSDKKVSIDDFLKVYTNASPGYEAGFLLETGVLKGKKITYQQLQKEISLKTDTMQSHILLNMRSYYQQLTAGLDYKDICLKVDSSSIFDDGSEFSMLLELKLTDHVSVVFEMNNDPPPTQIEYIWLSTGESLDDLVQKSKTIEKLMRPGIINDPDGFTNIRAKPIKNATITGKLNKGEIFYFTPTNASDWWLVYKQFGGKNIGYIHKSKIIEYRKFSSKLKQIVKKQREGC